MATHVDQRPNDSHEVWDSFSSEMRQQLETEDSVAWRGVTGILLTVVVAGVMLGIVGVLLSLNY